MGQGARCLQEKRLNLIVRMIAATKLPRSVRSQGQTPKLPLGQSSSMQAMHRGARSQVQTWMTPTEHNFEVKTMRPCARSPLLTKMNPNVTCQLEKMQSPN